MRSAIAAVVISGLAIHSVAADPIRQSKFDNDVFRIGIEIDEICDLHDGAPISDKCYGFLGAIIEIVKSDNLMGPPFQTGLKTCIPNGANITQIFEKIRPLLRVRVCGGFCTQTGYVKNSLHDAYPCQ